MGIFVREDGAGRASRRKFMVSAAGLGLAGMGLGLEKVSVASAATASSFNVMEYGAKGNGTADDAPAIQRALDAAGRVGGTVTVPAGTYRTRTALRMGDNTTLDLHAQATLLRDFNVQGPEGATIRNTAQGGAGNRGLTVRGGTLKAASPSAVGKHLGFQYVDGLRVEGVRFAGVYGDWNAALMHVSNAVVTGVVMDSGTKLFEDGIHIGGGHAITVSNCVLKCGDDAISLVQEWAEFGDIEDITVENCVVDSAVANAIRISTVTEREVRRVVIRGTTGTARASHGVLIEDASGRGRVHDITIDGMSLDQAGSQAAAVWVNGGRNIRLNAVTLGRTGARPFHIQNSTDVYVNRSEGTPIAAGLQSLLAMDSQNVNLDTFTSRDATQHGVVFVNVRNGSLHGCGAFSAADSGFELNNCTGIRVSDCEASGNAWGLRLSGSDYNWFMNNDFRGNSAGTVIGAVGANDSWVNDDGKRGPGRAFAPGVENNPSVRTAGIAPVSEPTPAPAAPPSSPRGWGGARPGQAARWKFNRTSRR